MTVRPAIIAVVSLLFGMGAAQEQPLTHDIPYEAALSDWSRVLAQPIGSLTQLQKIRLGKRSNPRYSLIKDLVPLANLQELVFGGWDIFPDNAYQAACKAGVLSLESMAPVREELESVQPWPGVFDQEYVRNLNGTHVKSASTKMELVEALIRDIEGFLQTHGLQRAVMVWCGSTEVFFKSGPVHHSLEAFEKGLKENAPEISPSMMYACRDSLRDSLCQWRAQSDSRHASIARVRLQKERSHYRKRFQNRADHDEDRLSPRTQSADARTQGMVFYQHSWQ